MLRCYSIALYNETFAQMEIGPFVEYCLSVLLADNVPQKGKHHAAAGENAFKRKS